MRSHSEVPFLIIKDIPVMKGERRKKYIKKKG